MIHEGQKEQKCPLCHFETNYKEYLKKHIETIHQGKKEHQCNICGVKFALRQNMKQHVAAVHEGKKTKPSQQIRH